MRVDPATAVSLQLGDKRYYFCSDLCKEAFAKRKRPAAQGPCQGCGGSFFLRHRLLITVLCAVFALLGSLVFPFLVPLRTALLSYIKTVWWAVLLGLFLGGLIDYYIPREYISKVLSRNAPATVFNAVFLGFLLSACSHGILALSIQLHKKGASGPAVVSFLLASPWANFTMTMMLVAFFGLKGLLIIAAALLIAVNTGFVFMALEKKGWIEKNGNAALVSAGYSIRADLAARLKNYRFSASGLLHDARGVISGMQSLSSMVLWWIMIGILVASAAGAYIPVHFFHRFMGPTLTGLLVTLLVATVIEVCSEGSSPFAFEIYRQTQAFGNSFVFLMAGVVTDYTEIGLLWSNVGRRTALWLPLISVPQVLFLGYLANLFLR